MSDTSDILTLIFDNPEMTDVFIDLGEPAEKALAARTPGGRSSELPAAFGPDCSDECLLDALRNVASRSTDSPPAPPRSESEGDRRREHGGDR